MVTDGQIDAFLSAMKRPPSKQQLRAEMQQQIQQYLREGGVVRDVPRGQSGFQNNANLFAQLGDNPPRQERTPLDNVVKALDARKKQPHSNVRTHKRARKKLITDDFGEPLRWVWVEE